jgi:hypothetical protein
MGELVGCIFTNIKKYPVESLARKIMGNDYHAKLLLHSCETNP